MNFTTDTSSWFGTEMAQALWPQPEQEESRKVCSGLWQLVAEGKKSQTRDSLEKLPGILKGHRREVEGATSPIPFRPQPPPPKKAGQLLPRPWTCINSHNKLSCFSLLLEDNLVPRKQRPFVLPLPEHRDHREADGGWVPTGSQEPLGATGCGVAGKPGPGPRKELLSEEGDGTSWTSPLPRECQHHPWPPPWATVGLGLENWPGGRPGGPSHLRGGELGEWHQALLSPGWSRGHIQ